MSIRFFKAVLFGGLLLMTLSCEEAPKKSTYQLDLNDDPTIAKIHKAYTEGIYTIEEVTQFYLHRIDSLDKNGPNLNAVLTVNPDALHIARQLDSQLVNSGIRGPLFGIPVMLKDNIDTGDKMPCTAGARSMAGSMPKEDSPIAAQLREAGAVILGKTNLSEWANFHSFTSSSGWSGLGGQTKNPYKLTHNPCGSSAGSGVAVSANLCVLAMGTETNGSIICPSNNNGIVGIKPTVGLISRRGVIPISNTQDTGGPMARTVKDAAIALGALVKEDPEDSATQQTDRKAYTNYLQFLQTHKMSSRRIGYFSKPLREDTSELRYIVEELVDIVSELGGNLVEVDSILHHRAGVNSYIAMQYEFKNGIDAYLLNLRDKASVTSLTDIVAKTFEDSVSMQFDHELLKMASEKGSLDEEVYKIALDSALMLAREKGLDRVMDSLNLDAIIAPSGSPAWPIDHENGDSFGVFSSSPAAIAGYPNITIPIGQVEGLPVGLSIFGRKWSEPVLLEIAYTIEQATKARKTPLYLP